MQAKLWEPLVQSRGQQAFSVKRQKLNVLDLKVHTTSVVTTQKAAVVNMWINGHDGFSKNFVCRNLQWAGVSPRAVAEPCVRNWWEEGAAVLLTTFPFSPLPFCWSWHLVMSPDGTKVPLNVLPLENSAQEVLKPLSYYRYGTERKAVERDEHKDTS